MTEEALWELLRMHESEGKLHGLEQRYQKQYQYHKPLLDDDKVIENALWSLRCLSYAHILQDRLAEALEEMLRLTLYSKRLFATSHMNDGKGPLSMDITPFSELSNAVYSNEQKAERSVIDSAGLIYETHLATMLQAFGLYQECLVLNARLLPSIEAIHGRWHKATIQSVFANAECHFALGFYKEASPLFLRACKGFSRLRNWKQMIRSQLYFSISIADTHQINAKNLISQTISSYRKMDINDKIFQLDVMKLLRKTTYVHPTEFLGLLNSVVSEALELLKSDALTQRLFTKAMEFLTFAEVEIRSLGLDSVADSLIAQVSFHAFNALLEGKPSQNWTKEVLLCIGHFERRHGNWIDAESFFLRAKLLSMHLFGKNGKEACELSHLIDEARQKIAETTVSTNLSCPRPNLLLTLFLPL